MQWLFLVMGSFLTLEGLIFVNGISELAHCRRRQIEPDRALVVVTVWAMVLMLLGIMLVCLMEVIF